MVTLAKTDKDAKIRGDIAAGLREGVTGKSGRAANNCKLWSEMLDEPDQPFTGKVAWLLAENEDCVSHWDNLLRKLDALVTAGKVQPPMGGIACDLHGQKRAKPEQKTRVLEIAKKLIESDKSPTDQRTRALQCVVGFDPEGKTFAARFVDSPVAGLKSEAVRATTAKP